MTLAMLIIGIPPLAALKVPSLKPLLPGLGSRFYWLVAIATWVDYLDTIILGCRVFIK
jgi:hypothetical protein